MTDQALISAKETSEGITSAIGLNKGMFTWDNLLSAAIALVVCILAIMIIMRIMRKMFARSKMEPSLANFILKVIKIALEFAAIMIVAGSLGFDVTALLAVFSLLGLAISLSVQNLLGNLVSGVVLLMNKPIRDGDYIQAGGAEGVVKNIGLFYTELNTLDNKVVNVPNSELSAGQIVNFTREPNRRVDLSFCAAYDAPMETVKKAILEAVAADKRILAEPAPFVRLLAYEDSSIRYVVRVWVKNADYWDVYFNLNEQVRESFAKNGVEMSYQHVNVHMVGK